ncbi:hypothetical protein KAF25_009190, partial [Fusarium avenaceum]
SHQHDTGSVVNLFLTPGIIITHLTCISLYTIDIIKSALTGCKDFIIINTTLSLAIPFFVATSQSNIASKKALRHAKTANKKAMEKAAENAKETAASQNESGAEAAIDLDENVDIYAIEKRIYKKSAQRVADQEAYWNLSVEELKAVGPNHVEFQPVWSDSEEIDRLMNYWTE